MDTLITGIHGFIGRNLVAAFKEKHILYGLDIVSPPTEGIVNTFYWNELSRIPPVDLIIHLAGIAHDIKNTIDAKKYYEINVGLTKRIFDYFLKSKVRKFMFFSSVKAVADSIQNEILTESYPPDPHTPYGMSKLEAEKYILSQPIQEEKQIYIFRPCMIHGPGNKGNLNLLFNFVRLGIPYPFGAFENKRSLTSIANLNFIITQIIEKDITSGIYQIADSESLSTNEIVSLITTVVGKKARIWHLNKKFLYKMAKIGDVLHLPFNSERLKKLTENYIVSNHKLIEALGVQLPVTSREGLLTTLKSFIHNSLI